LMADHHTLADVRPAVDEDALWVREENILGKSHTDFAA
jgi:hypothetical protein